MTIITSDAPFPRSWRIRTTQIECGSISKADTGCLQYYTGVYGRVKSFNFDPIAGLHLSNQDYSICIRTERNFCGIHYNVCPDMSRWHLNAIFNPNKQFMHILSYVLFAQTRRVHIHSHCRAIRIRAVLAQWWEVDHKVHQIHAVMTGY